MTCYVGKGDLPLNITWFFNHQPVRNIFGVATVAVGSRTNLLIINSVQSDHVGIYSCEASNSGGKVDYKAELFVNGTIHYVIADLFMLKNFVFLRYFYSKYMFFNCLTIYPSYFF